MSGLSGYFCLVRLLPFMNSCNMVFIFIRLEIILACKSFVWTMFQFWRLELLYFIMNFWNMHILGIIFMKIGITNVLIWTARFAWKLFLFFINFKINLIWNSSVSFVYQIPWKLIKNRFFKKKSFKLLHPCFKTRYSMYLYLYRERYQSRDAR